VTIARTSNRSHFIAALSSVFAVALFVAVGCDHSQTNLPNQAPIAHAEATPSTGNIPLTVTFAGSAFDTDGSISSYSWTFGDGGTASVQNPTHDYTAKGTFTATLTALDNDGAQGQATVSISVNNQPPVASPSATPTIGTIPLLVAFTGAATDPDGTIASYAWDFGDGGTSSLQNPTHNYTVGGSYPATLTVTDNDGATDSAGIVITVNVPANQAPTANAGPNQTNRDPGITIFLNGAASSDPDGSITSYQWTQTAGPGVTLSGASTATPSFVGPGSTTATFTFSLTVKDNGSPQLSAQDSVTVTTRVTYVNTTAAIFNAQCVGCHFSGNGTGRKPLDSYSGITAAPPGTIRSKINGGSMAQYLTGGQAGIITSWIDNGFPNTN
jgi:PKD repeat protein